MQINVCSRRQEFFDECEMGDGEEEEKKTFGVLNAMTKKGIFAREMNKWTLSLYLKNRSIFEHSKIRFVVPIYLSILVDDGGDFASFSQFS